MKIIQYGTSEYQDIVTKIANEIFNNRMMSFFGAGLTIGETTDFGENVPSGNEFKTIMINQIKQYTDEYDSEDLEPLEFYELSSVYFEVMNDNDVNVKPLFKKLFTNIHLNNDSIKANFLNLDWKTVYTLNIDDAIENCTKYNNIISPDMDINENLDDYKSVIKLHGDAKKNIIQNNNNLHETIVFSKEIYLKAIFENKQVLSYFISEMSRLNTLFYGCSFQALEFDLEAIIANEKQVILENKDLSRYFVTTKLPDKKIKVRKLKQDFLITHVIELNDRNNYDLFLNDIYKTVSNLHNTSTFDRNIYAEFELNASVINSSRENNIKFLLGLETIYKYCDYRFNSFNLPYYTIDRDLKYNFMNTFSDHTISVIKGRKLSGKTTFALNCFKNYENKTVYFISSTMDLAVNVLENMCKTLTNSIIILDTNSIVGEHLWKIKRNIHTLKENNSNIILIFNVFDNITLGSYNKIFQDENYPEYSILNYFTDTELSQLNEKLDSIPLPKFKNKIKIESGMKNLTRNQNILDNIIRINMTTYSDTEHIDWSSYKITKVKEFTFLFILSVLDKFNLSYYYLVYQGLNEVKKIVKKFSPFIEEQNISIYEHEQNSGAKVISNCQVCLSYLLANALEEKTFNIDEITSELSRIIGKLYKNKIQKYQDLLFFDNLQQNLQSKQHKEYFNEIVIDLYTKLENELTTDKHYWLQRAKSILYMQSNDIEAIKDGLRFATKVYTDELDSSSKLSGYASHISAMLYGRLINLENFEEIDNVKAAINYYYTTFTDYSWNTVYISNMIKRKDVNDLQPLCFSFDSSQLDYEYKDKLKEITNLYIRYR